MIFGSDQRDGNLKMNNVFVYGTLKPGKGNSIFLEGQKYLGKARTKDQYYLFGQGIPFAVPSQYPDERGGPLLGDVFLIDDECLLRLDYLEGHPLGYKRELRKVILLENNEELDCYIYEWQGSTKNMTLYPKTRDGCYVY